VYPGREIDLVSLRQTGLYLFRECACFAQAGALEETSLEDARAQFEW
jgi:hypothetical protein